MVALYRSFQYYFLSDFLISVAVFSYVMGVLTLRSDTGSPVVLFLGVVLGVTVASVIRWTVFLLILGAIIETVALPAGRLESALWSCITLIASLAVLIVFSGSGMLEIGFIPLGCIQAYKILRDKESYL